MFGQAGFELIFVDMKVLFGRLQLWGFCFRRNLPLRHVRRDLKESTTVVFNVGIITSITINNTQSNTNLIPIPGSPITIHGHYHKQEI
ncbi:hypothetical protein L3X38_017981 [Prunus dulcis]|uniref:Uncharacterized protein n=1 Tax=Prunus dulcis TaxID=3755 RepID=A0AAD4ZAP0_PRUDU|nr:hypothetical protein L3X38_017981 [Prunus dulcis]